MNDRNAPATKGDIADLEHKVGDLEHKVGDLGQKVGDLEQKVEQLRSEVNHGYADLAERISDSETRLLKAFYDFAQSNQKRMTEIEVSEAAMRSRLATIEDRLLQVEKRLNLPGAA